MFSKLPFRVKLAAGIAVIAVLLGILTPLLLIQHYDSVLKKFYVERFDKAMGKLDRATSDQDRFYSLTEVATMGFLLGKTNEARVYARKLLAMAPKFREDWNYGNAIHDGNMVLGRIAVREGRIEDAKRFLIEAGKSPGSPQLDSFGPDMGLAKDLLEKGERDTVLEYFQLCRKFWEVGRRGKLDQWTKDVKAGKMPDFGLNLY
jgi:tetratricopeptide (TPR) repeat protein